ncbi:general stress protein [Subtercola sp. PAMC28395]|uniref:general stress protein n=1 Tax=Subtercola sp. PAMC28395 TaxID=2846775 RepID=UPI00209AD7BC|nr:general stress protein [Subtercola sp. PAMC28395]
MTNQMPGMGRNPRTTPRIPRGEVVETFETYEDAQQAVDVLARADFPVNQLAIIGSDLKTVENVTGKLSYGRAALAGAFSGAWMGLFFGLLLVIFSPNATSFGFVAAAILIGAGFGMLFGIVSYTITRRRRDFTSTMQVVATSYSILADPEVANRARNIIAPDATWGQAPAPQHPSDPLSAP